MTASRAPTVPALPLLPWTVRPGAPHLIVPRGWPAPQHVAVVNPYRVNDAEIAAGIVAAVNAHPQIVTALMDLVAASGVLLRSPGAGHVAELRASRARAFDVLARTAIIRCDQ